jgi:uncharacterized damage-inducible protein DinB
MKMSSQFANQFREALLNGTWISTNYNAQISDVTFKEATTKVGTLNTIAALTFHINYYVSGVNQVLEGGTLDIRDKYSFDLPTLASSNDWEHLRAKFIADAIKFASLVEQMNDEKLQDGFVKEQYGTYQRNILGMIEHSYYHLGQIVLIKKLIKEGFGNK